VADVIVGEVVHDFAASALGADKSCGAQVFQVL
jgi:hypothetical protein